MNSFNRLSLRSKILVVVGVVLALMLAVSTGVYSGVATNEDDVFWVNHTYQVIEKIDSLLASLVNMETGYRGFLITGKEEFLEPLNSGTQTYMAALADIRQLTKDNPAQIERERRLEAAVQAWRSTVLEQGIALRRNVAGGEAQLADLASFEASGEGKRHFDELRTIIAELRAEEGRLLDQRNAHMGFTTQVLRATLIGGTAAALLMGLLFAFLIAAGIARRVGLVAQAARSMAEGRVDERYNLPEGPDEVGVLATAFNSMTVSLRQARETERRARETERELREAEANSRRVLEQTVADYLAFVQGLAQGNLIGRLEVRRDGALGQLGQGLNDMADNLHRITCQIQEANSAIASAAAEILASTTQQAASAAEQSSAISQTTTTIEEVKAIAAQTAQQAGQMAKENQNALGVAREGSGAVEDTVHGMTQIRARVQNIAQTILSLAEQTQAINVIITTVSELADQSNLLALNAAIEAARAGEQGKSFAVVAQHVRDLAERSKTATVQVRDILGDIQRGANTAVLVTEEGSKGVEAGSKLALQAGQVIHRIATEVETGAQASMQIAAAAQQQTTGMLQIGQAMTSIQQATTQALASTRQAERAAQDLHTLAQSLQKAIAVYRL
jgi:methyl-accepting chemotaxis protein